MEALLSMAFDNIASKDAQKIRKGLRQIEGMLAQICLSSGKTAPTRPGHRRNQSAINLGEQPQSTPKKLGQLAEDPAFREFFRLQEGFEWNVALRVADCLERLLGLPSSKGTPLPQEARSIANSAGADGQNDLLILSSLSNLQGLLLLHPPSRTIFGRENKMNLLLDLLDSFNCPAIQSAALLVLVTALIATPQNTRIFEDMDGLLTVTTLFKDEDTTKQVKMKLLEFLYFYLMPEAPVPATSPRSPTKLVGVFERRGSTAQGEDGGAQKKSIRSQEEKQHDLSQYLNNVEGLVQDLQEYAPFTSVAAR